MKLFRSTLIFSLLFASTSVSWGADAYQAQVVKTGQQVAIYWDNVFSVDGTGEIEPLHRLSRELKSSKATKFRLKWGVFAPNYPSVSNIFYNRKTGELSYYSSTEVGGMGNEHVRNPVISHWVITGVKDRYIDRLAKKYSHPTTIWGDAYFSELVYFGCRIRYLRKP